MIFNLTISTTVCTAGGILTLEDPICRVFHDSGKITEGTINYPLQVSLQLLSSLIMTRIRHEVQFQYGVSLDSNMSFRLKTDESQTLKRVDHNPIRPYTSSVPFKSIAGGTSVNLTLPISAFVYCSAQPKQKWCGKIVSEQTVMVSISCSI